MSRYAELLNRLEKQREDAKKHQEASTRPIPLPKTRRFGFNRFYVYLVLALVVFFTLSMYFFGVIQGMRLAMDSAVKEESAERGDFFPADEIKIVPVAEEPSVPVLSGGGEVSPPSGPADEVPAAVTTPVSGEVTAPKTAFAIQLATYNQKSRADQEVIKLKEKFPAAFARESGRYYVLFLGTFSGKEEAQKSLIAMKQSGLRETYPDAFIRPYES